MPKIHQLTEKDAAILKSWKAKTKGTKDFQRFQALYLRASGRKNKEVAQITDYTERHLSKMVKQYLEQGPESLLDKRNGGNSRKLSPEEEKAVLDEFLEQGESGQILTAKEIRLAFEEKTETHYCQNAIYGLLKRHGWRKIKPRPQHPKQPSPEVIADSKKLTP